MKVNCKESLYNSVRFYHKAKHVGLIENETGKALKNKKGFPPKRIVVGKDEAILNLLSDTYRDFYIRYRSIYIVPLDDYTGNIYGFLLRAVEEKAFRVISGSPVMFYGLQDFKYFMYARTLILTEGFKDAEAIKVNGYPFCLALLSSYLSKAQEGVIKSLAGKVIFIGDSDYFGRLHSSWMGRKLGFTFYNPPKGDLGDYFSDDNEEVGYFIKGLLRTVV